MVIVCVPSLAIWDGEIFEIVIPAVTWNGAPVVTNSRPSVIVTLMLYEPTLRDGMAKPGHSTYSSVEFATVFTLPDPHKAAELKLWPWESNHSMSEALGLLESVDT